MISPENGSLRRTNSHAMDLEGGTRRYSAKVREPTKRVSETSNVSIFDVNNVVVDAVVFIVVV